MALALGRTLEEIEQLPAREFRRWEAFDRISPIGHERFDQLAALAPWCISMIARSKKGRDPVLEDWIMQWGKEEKKQTPHDHAKILQALFGTAIRDGQDNRHPGSRS